MGAWMESELLVVLFQGRSVTVPLDKLVDKKKRMKNQREIRGRSAEQRRTEEEQKEQRDQRKRNLSFFIPITVTPLGLYTQVRELQRATPRYKRPNTTHSTTHYAYGPYGL